MKYSKIEELKKEEIENFYSDILVAGNNDLLTWVTYEFYCSAVCTCKDGTNRNGYCYRPTDIGGNNYGWDSRHACCSPSQQGVYGISGQACEYSNEYFVSCRRN